MSLAISIISGAIFGGGFAVILAEYVPFPRYCAALGLALTWGAIMSAVGHGVFE